MNHNKPCKNYVFVSSLSEPMQKYVAENRALGNLFNKESQILARLDKLIVSLGQIESELTKEIVEIWIVRNSNEKRINQKYRLNFIKRFAKFMIQRGYKAYCPNVVINAREDKSFVPYVFTKDETSKILRYFDNFPKSNHNPFINIVYPVLFRTLYCCGLRVSEVVNLKVGDVEIDSGILHIYQSKNEKSRVVPMSTELAAKFKQLSNSIHATSCANDVFFPNSRKKPYSTGTIYTSFRTAMRIVGIPHGGRGEGPRLHDLRHTFAVHCLQKWESSGIDTLVVLPYLSSYLGHHDIGDTQKYLRLTCEVHSQFVEKMCNSLGDVIPRLEVSKYESS